LVVAAGVSIGGLAACSSASKPAPPPNASTLIGAGTALYKQGNYDAAAQLFNQALAVDPTNATAHYDLGTAYQAENQIDDARAQYQQAIARDPTMVSAMYNEAILDASRDPATALFLYRKVVAIKPDSPTAYLNLGVLEHQQGLKSQAGNEFRKAISLQPSLRSLIPGADLADLTLPAPQPPHPTATTRPAR
jgi:tetratricopeptide (TPR) repeat protein